MLIAKNRKEFIEIIELMEKYGIETCGCGNELLTVKAFNFNYKHSLKTAGLSVDFNRSEEKNNFFDLIHERKNEKYIEIPGKDELVDFKYLLEKFYKIKFEEVPGVESNYNKK